MKALQHLHDCVAVKKLGPAKCVAVVFTVPNGRVGTTVQQQSRDVRVVGEASGAELTGDLGEEARGIPGREEGPQGGVDEDARGRLGSATRRARIARQVDQQPVDHCRLGAG